LESEEKKRKGPKRKEREKKSQKEPKRAKKNNNRGTGVCAPLLVLPLYV